METLAASASLSFSLKPSQAAAVGIKSVSGQRVPLPSATSLKSHSAPQPLRIRATAAPNSSAPVAAAAEVPRVKLGKTDVEVPIIGVGAWAWGDKFFWNDGEWNDRNVRDAKQAFDAAMDSGLNFIDTAEVYGTKQFGADDSESLLGRFIKERAGKSQAGDLAPIVATKFAALPWRFGRESVVGAVKESLRRLQLDCVDLYQLHWPGVWGNEGYIDGLADCVDQGLVKAVGVSNYKLDRLQQAHQQLAKRGVPLASNQVHYNILYRVPESNGVKQACDDLGVTIIAYSPLSQGVLSGKYSPQKPPTGPRANSYSPDFIRKAQPLLQRMAELGEKYGGRSKTQVALNWLVVQGNIVPIPGAKNRAQAAEFAGALGWSLTAEEVQELRELASRVPQAQGFPAEAF
ncbi:unnamed protein product [Closterium sp. NIES-64]|nr:unnamed protein product [Closterium sp. NIES-65]CAI5984294.1 unnamed protein product [Closterium sp. NIES-65]CAI5988011.1 unnamed protein product [Closterium sp. NIES-64]